MTKIEDIVKAVEQLAPEELEMFRRWFEEFVAVRFDERIGRDARSGMLNALARVALEDFHKGRASEI